MIETLVIAAYLAGFTARIIIRSVVVDDGVPF
jgi:hypothetical protein